MYAVEPGDAFAGGTPDDVEFSTATGRLLGSMTDTGHGGLPPPRANPQNAQASRGVRRPAEEMSDEATLKTSIAKLHTNLGHPANEALARAIRLTGGSDTAVGLALKPPVRCLL